MDQGQALPSTRRHSTKSKQYVEVSGNVGTGVTVCMYVPMCVSNGVSV